MVDPIIHVAVFLNSCGVAIRLLTFFERGCYLSPPTAWHCAVHTVGSSAKNLRADRIIRNMRQHNASAH